MLILPTKNRPQNLEAIFQSYSDTKVTEPITLIIENSDESYNNIKIPDNFQIFRCPAGSVIEKTNFFYNKIKSEVSYLGWLADDLVPLTQNWDIILKEGCLRYGMAYGDDGFQHSSLPTHPFVSIDRINLFGYFWHSDFNHNYVDNILLLQSQVLGYKYYSNVKFEHRHHLNGKSEKDKTYSDAYEKFEIDKQKFISIKNQIFTEAINIHLANVKKTAFNGA